MMMSDDVYTNGKELDLKREMKRTIEAPELPAGGVLRFMFETVDSVCGKAGTLPKFMVLEMLSRYPFWARQHGSHAQLVRLYCRSAPPSQQDIEKVLQKIRQEGEAQDSAPWHMLLWADLSRQRGITLSVLKHVLIPHLLTFATFRLAQMKTRENGALAAGMNAAFASHMEHEYMLFAREHPEYETVPVESVWFGCYPRKKSLADLVRRVGLDERDRMNHALEEAKRLAVPASR